MSTLRPLWRELLGAALRAERHRQQCTLSDIAAISGVSTQHLSDVERGRKDPSSEVLDAVTGALGLDVATLAQRIAIEAAGAPAPRVASTREQPSRRSVTGPDAAPASAARRAVVIELASRRRLEPGRPSGLSEGPHCQAA